MERGAGIIMPISSLPSKYGIGTLGKEAYKFADFLKAAGQKYWQVLPLGPTSYGDSPYASFSTFAGNPYFIDLDMLIEDGLLLKSEVKDLSWGSDPRHVDYGKIYENRAKALRIAKERGWESDAEKVGAFMQESKAWISDYALFMAVKKKFGMASWLDWPDEDIRMRKPEALEKYKEELRDDYEFFIYIQYLFFEQWRKLRAYIKDLGIKIIGDVPIYVAMDSADVWSAPYYFELDEENQPVAVSGVPPDYFCEDGQLWGGPLYDWKRMKQDGYKWWIERIHGSGELFDVIRIDHFRGFDTYWRVPAGNKTARDGKWMQGPGMGLVGMLTEWFPEISFIAEDLGELAPSVEKLLKDSGLPGMKVLQFAFDSGEESGYMPHMYTKNCVCYTGTHDNVPLAEWYKTAKKKDVKHARKYMNIKDSGSKAFCRGMIKGGMRSVADLFIAPMQDYLCLGSGSRMNAPGSAYGNWTWRMLPGEAGKKLAKKIKKTTVMYGRYKDEIKENAEDERENKA